jgi:putative ATP-binding cassette transporter
LTLFNKTIDTISMMLGILFALPKFVMEKMSVGDLMQMASAFSYVVNGLCFFMDAYAQIAAWRAVIDRLIEFSDQMSLVDQQVNPCIQGQSRDTALHIQRLTIHTPSGRALLSDWSETIQTGERVLVMGAFGCGKSTLLRCIAGLWPFAQGRIDKPHGHFLYVAQKPYFPIGTLKAALNFGYGPFSEAAIVKALTALQLQRFVPLLDQENHWMQCLSLGEQQMLSITRILLIRPDWLFLDEATASLDAASETVVYHALIEALPHLTLVSIGHRTSLAAYHSRTLHL